MVGTKVSCMSVSQWLVIVSSPVPVSPFLLPTVARELALKRQRKVNNEGHNANAGARHPRHPGTLPPALSDRRAGHPCRVSSGDRISQYRKTVV
jgi:hypothetical protein